jgi:hypothetical protein
MILTIFSGIEVLFFLIGIITMLAIFALQFFHRQYKPDWKSWALLVSGFIILLFAIAWSVSSIQEGEPRAASMGMVFFGIPSLILLALGRRLMLKSGRK